MAAENVFELIIFDYDGTLSDTRLAIAHCLERALMSHSRSLPGERLMPAVNSGLPLRDTLLLLDPALHDDRGVLEEIVTTYRAVYRDEGEPLIQVFPGAREALKELHASGIECVVVSNKGFDAVVRSLDRHGMTPFLTRVFAERPGFPVKPDPELLNDHILQRALPVPRERTLMVGDTEIDIAFAKRAGIASCWAAYGFGDRESCLALSPTHVIEAIGELPALVHLTAGLGAAHG
ncbi:MAG TPA: HAD family hydrolase, partial [Xanthobacteraceae bacterium]|nr:HAD family hydrolase [Xanthobacteraceae bacterium]